MLRLWRRKLARYCMAFSCEGWMRLPSALFYMITVSSFSRLFPSLNIASHNSELGLPRYHNKVYNNTSFFNYDIRLQISSCAWLMLSVDCVVQSYIYVFQDLFYTWLNIRASLRHEKYLLYCIFNHFLTSYMVPDLTLT